MLTADYVVEYLCQKMGHDEKNYGIRWMDYDIGHAAIVHGVLLYIHTAHTRPGPFIVLTLVKDGKETHIWEPKIHFSQAPMGKAWHALCRFTTKLLLVLLEIQIPPFKKGPRTPIERENERIRINLNRLFLRVAKQTDLYPRAENKELKELLKRSRQVLHNGHHLQYTEIEYGRITQELFRALTIE